jgi:hypothetical protein
VRWRAARSAEAVLAQTLPQLPDSDFAKHTFRTGRRRGTTPYQRLGLPWPEGLRWWDVSN